VTSNLHHSELRRAAPFLLLLLAAFPPLAVALGQEFYVGFATRVMIFGMAAASLNLILGFGRMVSFGHAAFFGLGAYVVAILMQHGVTSAWLAWPAAIAAGALLALAIGAVSLRTRGVYFIMITLAFAQMVYYVAVSLKIYGGDDGLALPARSSLGMGLDLKHDATFYYVVLALLAAVLYAMRRLVNARFGRVLQAIGENEARMEAIGFPVYRYKLIGFVIAGALAGLAGALIANQNGLVSPNLLNWPQSGVLMIMVILGGVGYLYGGVLGAVVMLALEEVLSAYTVHWQLGLGLVLLAVVLYAPKGLMSLARRRARHG
jgi:branched-chain amino acid transport system permease protein